MPKPKNPNPPLDWCQRCGKYFPYRKGRDKCPVCDTPVTMARCCRCGYEWTFVTRRPKMCPKCKNVRWMQMRDES